MRCMTHARMNAMARMTWTSMLLLLLSATGARGQEVVRQDELLGPDRPEAWAMRRSAATTLMTAFGELPALGRGQWQVAVDVGAIPHLSTEERRVGFNGEKIEDLNKSPVFARLRASVGLPAGWVGELGYTPPLTINGAKAHDLFDLAIGHRLVTHGNLSLSLRAFGQHGSVHGDITCPASLAGVTDLDSNPYGCQARSNDEVTLNDYGIDLTGGLNRGSWHWHATAGVVRTELQAQVDALTFDVRDRSRLVANGTLHYGAIGVRRDIGRHWSLGTEVLYVPQHVRRGDLAERTSEPLTSLRIQVRYRP
jgi:hypothetical protein